MWTEDLYRRMEDSVYKQKLSHESIALEQGV